jgi:hypothetical protein
VSSSETRPWFRSKDGLRWVPVRPEGWAALLAIIGLELLVVISAVQQVMQGRPLFMILVVLATPVTLAVLFWLLSRKGKIVSDSA